MKGISRLRRERITGLGEKEARIIAYFRREGPLPLETKEKIQEGDGFRELSGGRGAEGIILDTSSKDCHGGEVES